MKPRGTAKRITLLVVIAVFGAWSLLSAIYCAWLTATPLPAGRVGIVQFQFYVWLTLAVLSLVAFVGIIVATVRRRREKQGSEVTQII